MLMKINDERIQSVPVEDILLIGDGLTILGFTNNSKTFTLELLSERYDNIKLMGKTWNEYLEMIKYTRQILKKGDVINYEQ